MTNFPISFTKALLLQYRNWFIQNDLYDWVEWADWDNFESLSDYEIEQTLAGVLERRRNLSNQGMI